MKTFITIAIALLLHLIIINIVYANETEIKETTTTNDYLVKTTSIKPLPTVNTDTAIYIKESSK